MKGIEVKAFDSPDEVRRFGKRKLELLTIEERTVGRRPSNRGGSGPNR
jgi:hypothetical protein